ncbi:MAG TPA: methylated-DNA--[protein]-cysteine S-methyltransferase [Geobacteraceae bacterium]|nr:methylated-DNA--[protein]-cysteine S-methyltransferase [Geobacteraceae bacterium]
MSDISYDLVATRFGYGAVVAGMAGVVEVFLPFGKDSAESAVAEVLQAYPDALQGGGCARLAAEELESYCAGETVRFTAPLDLHRLTSFQLAVSRQVLTIGYGKVCSYGEVARDVGSPKAARGVGAVMAANRLPILVPCHRVVAADGSLTGYSGCGGIDSKRILLQMEGVRFSAAGKVIVCDNS